MSKFADFCADYFKRYFDLHPSEAIYYGVGGYDHLLNDYSDETYQSEKAFVEESLAKLRQISVNDLNQDEAIDHAVLEGRLTIQQYEHAKEDYRLKWPDSYSPIDAIYILTVRATNDLSANLLSRLGRTPGLIRQGIANLSRRQANPPKLKIRRRCARPSTRQRARSTISPLFSNAIFCRAAAESTRSVKSILTCCLRKNIS